METYFDIGGLAKYLGYAEKTIRKWVLNREIPYHKIHKTVRFRLSEIERWVDGDVSGGGNGTGGEGLTDEVGQAGETVSDGGVV